MIMRDGWILRILCDEMRTKLKYKNGNRFCTIHEGDYKGNII